jgi:hypothetical protein
VSRVWRTIRPYLAGLLVIVALLALILVPAAATSKDVAPLFGSLQGVARNATHAEQTTVGPLPGDITKYDGEQRCQEKIATPGYWSAMNAAELADGQRTGIYPCASFLGSRTEPNIVYAYKAEGYYPYVYYVVNDGPNAMYVASGAPASTGPVAPVPYVARINPITGEQVWRTVVENANVDNDFLGSFNLNILANGNIVFAWATKIALLDRETGAIIKMRELPTPGATARSVNYKELTVAPDGTIILRSQNRPNNCNQQGGGGLSACSQTTGGPELDPSPMLAIDPDTLKVLDGLAMPEDSATPTLIADYQGKIAIYNAMQQHAYRVFWDPDTQKLSLDKSWQPSYLVKGQTVGDAPTYMGNWIVIQTNGIGSTTKASSIVAISVDDPTNLQRIYPFGQLQSGQKSNAPPKPEGDLENDMVYSADGGVGKIAGIHLDQATGKMTTKWVVDDRSFEFQPLFGPADDRILVTTRWNPDASLGELATGSYTQQVVWRDAATGKVIAESPFLPPVGFNALVAPTYGGRFVYPAQSSGSLYFLQPMPASSQPPVATTVESSPSPTASATPAG